jgi:hypothetical protein
MCYLQAKQGRVCAQVDSDQDTLNRLMDEVDEAELGLKKAARRGRADLNVAKKRLEQANEQAAVVRRSREYQRHKSELRQLLSHFPELILMYPKLEPFRGTAGEVRCQCTVCSVHHERICILVISCTCHTRRGAPRVYLASLLSACVPGVASVGDG